MNTVKKLLSLLLITALLQPAAAAPDRRPQDRLFRYLQERVEKPSVQKREQFYQSAYEELSDYYNRRDFASPSKASGWYRVNNFLNWLKQNEKQVQQDFRTVFPSVCAEDSCSMNWNNWHIYERSWWVFLGVHYVADKQKKPADYSRLSFLFCNESTCSLAGKGDSKHAIKINIDDSYSIPGDINTGIHEGTHLLPYLFHTNDQHLLSEFATFWTSCLYALPVKNKDVYFFSNGIRDFIRTANAKPDLLLHWEYHPYVAGRFLIPQLQRMNLLSLTADRNPHDDEALIQTVINYIYAAHGRYFAENSAPDLINLVLVSPSWDELIKQNFATRAQLENWFGGQYPAYYSYIGQVNLETLPEVNLTGKQHIFIKDSCFDCPKPPQKRFYPFTAATPVSKEEYLKQIYSPFEVTEELQAFYSNIEKALPAEVKNEMFSKIPAIYEPMFASYTPNDKERLSQLILYKYGKTVTKATLQALKQGGIKPLAVPAGYM